MCMYVYKCITQYLILSLHNTCIYALYSIGIYVHNTCIRRYMYLCIYNLYEKSRIQRTSIGLTHRAYCHTNTHQHTNTPLIGKKHNTTLTYDVCWCDSKLCGTMCIYMYVYIYICSGLLGLHCTTAFAPKAINTSG